MQFPQFVLSSSCERENEYEDRGGDMNDGNSNLHNSHDGAGPHQHRHPLPGSAAVSSPEADLWMQPWLEYHGSFGGYTCHLCQRSRLEGPQAVRFHVQEPLHQNSVEQLQRDRRQASILLQRWNLIHSQNSTRSRHGDSSASAASAVEEQQSSLLRGANRFHQNINNFSRPTNFVFGAMSLARRSGTTAAAGADESSLLLVRIDRLGLPAWRDAVQASLFRYLSLQDEGIDDSSLQQAHRILNKYEHWERIALLELAVWKATCLVEMPPEAGTDYYAAKAWLESGWKTLKSAERQSNAVDIVLSRVVPFLDRSSPDDQEEESTSTTTATAPASFVPGETARPRRRLIHQRRLRFHNQLPVAAALWRVNNNNSAVDYLRGASRRLVRAQGHLPNYLPHNGDDDDDDDAGAGGEDDYDFDGFPAWAQDM